MPLVGLAEIVANVQTGFKARTLRVEGLLWFVLIWKNYFVGLKYFISLSELLNLLKNFDKAAFIGISILLHLVKKYFRDVAALTMFFCDQKKSVDELPLPSCWVGFILLIAEKVLIDPNLPLIVDSHSYHLLSRAEISEDVKQSVIPDHHLLDKINYLGKGKQIDV